MTDTDTDAAEPAAQPAGDGVVESVVDDALDDGAALDEAAVIEDAAVEPAVELTPLEFPVDGVPPVVESERDLLASARASAAGEGPLALVSERASV